MMTMTKFDNLTDLFVDKESQALPSEIMAAVKQDIAADVKAYNERTQKINPAFPGYKFAAVDANCSLWVFAVEPKQDEDFDQWWPSDSQYAWRIGNLNTDFESMIRGEIYWRDLIVNLFE